MMMIRRADRARRRHPPAAPAAPGAPATAHALTVEVGVHNGEATRGIYLEVGRSQMGGRTVISSDLGVDSVGIMRIFISDLQFHR